MSYPDEGAASHADHIGALKKNKLNILVSAFRCNGGAYVSYDKVSFGHLAHLFFFSISIGVSHSSLIRIHQFTRLPGRRPYGSH